MSNRPTSDDASGFSPPPSIESPSSDSQSPSAEAGSKRPIAANAFRRRKFTKKTTTRPVWRSVTKLTSSKFKGGKFKINLPRRSRSTTSPNENDQNSESTGLGRNGYAVKLTRTTTKNGITREETLFNYEGKVTENMLKQFAAAAALTDPPRNDCAEVNFEFTDTDKKGNTETVKFEGKLDGKLVRRLILIDALDDRSERSGASSGQSELAKRVLKDVAMKLRPQKKGGMGQSDTYEDTLKSVGDRNENWSDSSDSGGWCRFVIGKTTEYVTVAGVTLIVIGLFHRFGPKGSGILKMSP